jgi:hypothetical protein
VVLELQAQGPPGPSARPLSALDCPSGRLSTLSQWFPPNSDPMGSSSSLSFRSCRKTSGWDIPTPFWGARTAPTLSLALGHPCGFPPAADASWEVSRPSLNGHVISFFLHFSTFTNGARVAFAFGSSQLLVPAAAHDDHDMQAPFCRPAAIPAQATLPACWVPP